MAYQVQTFQAPPIPPDLQNARDFKQLRESVKNYLGLLSKFHNDTFQTITRNANQNSQGAGAPIASAASITITQPIHTITGTAAVNTIIAPKGFQGQLMLVSQDGFSITNTGNISTLNPLNYLGPGAFMHFTFHANENRWFGDSCRLQDVKGGGPSLVPTGSGASGAVLQKTATGSAFSTATYPSDVAAGDLLYGSAVSTITGLADVAAGSYLRSGGPVWSTLKLPNAATIGDLLLATAANSIANLADVATGQVLASGGVGAPPAYTPTPTVTDLTATGKVQAATLNVTTHVTQGGGLKHQRVTTGSIAASTSVDVTLTWTAAFADANYTPSASVIEATANLRVIAIKSISATQVVVTVHNDDAGGAHTGDLAVIALHD